MTEFGKELRESPRVNTGGGEVRLEFRTLANFLVSYADNVSTDGLFVETEDFLPVGSRFHISVVFTATNESFEGFVEVRWVRPDPNGEGPAGMGLQFAHIDDKGRKIIDQILAQHKAD